MEQIDTEEIETIKYTDTEEIKSQEKIETIKLIHR